MNREGGADFFPAWAEVSINRYTTGYLSNVVNVDKLMGRLLNKDLAPMHSNGKLLFFPSCLYSEGLMNSKDCQGEQIQTSFSPLLPKLTLLSYFWNCFGPCLVKSSYRRWVGSQRCFCSAQILSTLSFLWPKMVLEQGWNVSCECWWCVNQDVVDIVVSLDMFINMLLLISFIKSNAAYVQEDAILKPVKHVRK